MQSLSTQRVSSCRPAFATQRPRLASVLPSRHSVKAHAALPRWEAMFEYLSNRNTQSIDPMKANEMMEAGTAVMVDVRPEPNFDKSHIEGAVNVPLYKLLTPTNAGATGFVKWLAFSMNGVQPVEMNENFVADMKTAAAGRAVIVACEAGGTLRPSTNFSMGKASRSFQALYRALTECEISTAKHLDRGLYGWYQADLPFTGDYTPELGRTPNAASDPTMKVTLASGGYTMRPEDKA